MSANGQVRSAPAAWSRPGPVPSGYGEHEGHNVHPHDHSWQTGDRTVKGCSGRWFCMTCKEGKMPGTWFWGPECPRPAVVKEGKR